MGYLFIEGFINNIRCLHCTYKLFHKKTKAFRTEQDMSLNNEGKIMWDQEWVFINNTFEGFEFRTCYIILGQNIVQIWILKIYGLSWEISRYILWQLWNRPHVFVVSEQFTSIYGHMYVIMASSRQAWILKKKLSFLNNI